MKIFLQSSEQILDLVFYARETCQYAIFDLYDSSKSIQVV